MFCHLHSIILFYHRTLSFRKFKSVDVDSLNDDLAKSDLCKNPPHDLEELVISYNKTLKAVLDKHAPVKTRTIVVRPRVPWYTDEIRHAKRERRKAERRWRLSKLDSDVVAFKIKRNAVNNLINNARRAFILTSLRKTLVINGHYFVLVNACLISPRMMGYLLTCMPQLLLTKLASIL